MNSPVRFCGASWWLFVIGRGNYISGEQAAQAESAQRLATEMGEEPEEERECRAENEAGDDGKIESGVFAAMDDVAGEFAEAKR